MSVTRPPGEAHLMLGMSALLFTGGLAGYIRGKSVPSLVAGLAFGSGYAFSAYMLTKGDGKEGHGLGFGLSAGLSASMGMRYMKSRKFMPAGLLATVGVLSGGYSLKKLIEWW